MHVFRLSKRKYSSDLNGKGAAKSNNRWNSKGTEMIYTAESRALAMAEVLVHLSMATLPGDYGMMEIYIPENIEIAQLDIKMLGKMWNQFPPSKETQNIGNHFISSNKACILKVPSAVVKGDNNYLINPHHQDFKKVTVKSIVDFPFDKRILL